MNPAAGDTSGGEHIRIIPRRSSYGSELIAVLVDRVFDKLKININTKLSAFKSSIHF